MTRAKTPAAAAPEAPAAGLEVITNSAFQVVDNTEAVAEPEAPVETDEVQLIGDFVQVNYR